MDKETKKKVFDLAVNLLEIDGSNADDIAIKLIAIVGGGECNGCQGSGKVELFDAQGTSHGSWICQSCGGSGYMLLEKNHE